MFWKKKHPDEYRELMSHLIDGWEMKHRYASAFLDQYRANIGKMMDSGRRKAKQVRATNAGLEGTMLALDFEDPDLVLVCQAYFAYMNDLRRGRFVGTDTEKAIWAILANRSDLLENVDKSFAEYVRTTHETQFSDLFDDVYRMND